MCREFCRSMSKRGLKAQSKLSRVLERTRLSRALRRDSSRYRSLSLHLSIFLFGAKKHALSATTREIRHYLCPNSRPNNGVVGVILKRKKSFGERHTRQRACTTRCVPPLFLSPFKLRAIAWTCYRNLSDCSQNWSRRVIYPPFNHRLIGVSIDSECEKTAASGRRTSVISALYSRESNYRCITEREEKQRAEINPGDRVRGKEATDQRSHGR